MSQLHIVEGIKYDGFAGQSLAYTIRIKGVGEITTG